MVNKTGLRHNNNVFLTFHVLELHNCTKNLECELSFSIETFLIETKPLLICSTVGKLAKRIWDTKIETTIVYW